MNENRSQIAVDRSQLVEEAFGLAGFTVIRDLRSVNFSLCESIAVDRSQNRSQIAVDRSQLVEDAFGLAGFTVIRDLRSVNFSLCEYSYE